MHYRGVRTVGTWQRKLSSQAVLNHQTQAPREVCCSFLGMSPLSPGYRGEVHKSDTTVGCGSEGRSLHQGVPRGGEQRTRLAYFFRQGLIFVWGGGCHDLSFFGQKGYPQHIVMEKQKRLTDLLDRQGFQPTVCDDSGVPFVIYEGPTPGSGRTGTLRMIAFWPRGKRLSYATLGRMCDIATARDAHTVLLVTNGLRVTPLQQLGFSLTRHRIHQIQC